MKKISVILAILVALTIVGCQTTGGAAKSGGGGAPYSVDLSKMQFCPVGAGDVVGAPIGESTRNIEPLTKAWDDVFLLFPELPANITSYARLTVRAKYYGVAADGKSVGDEIEQGDSNAIVSLIYDFNPGDLRGPAMGPGANTPVKEFNVGGFSGIISTEKGIRMRLTKPPKAILFQNNHAGVKFIEVTEITFHD